MTTEELLQSLPPIGSIWRHYKGGIYVVRGFGRDEETCEIGVLYLPIEISLQEFPLSAIPWFRKLRKWLDPVMLDGKQILRYSRVEDSQRSATSSATSTAVSGPDDD